MSGCEHLTAVHVLANEWKTTEWYVVNGVTIKEEDGDRCNWLFDYCPLCGDKL